MQTIENKIINRIRAYGHGWSFSHVEFARMGSRSAIDQALCRLTAKGRIRRVIRGIYDCPRLSKLLGKTVAPDIHQVAQALARKFRWRIQPSGPAALNAMGLSTQVPGQMVYLSDGPSRSYVVGKSKLAFRKTALKDAVFKLPQSASIVHGLKSLGPNAVTPQVIDQIRAWLGEELRQRVLTDTRTVTGWVYKTIRQICREDGDG